MMTGLTNVGTPSGLSRNIGTLWQVAWGACFWTLNIYFLIHAPPALIVAFWHISNIPHSIWKNLICYSTPMFCITSIFLCTMALKPEVGSVKYKWMYIVAIVIPLGENNCETEQFKLPSGHTPKPASRQQIIQWLTVKTSIRPKM